MSATNTPTSTDAPQPPFVLPPGKQELIYTRLCALVSSGIGEHYKDACRIMATQPPFATTTQLVSHLLREIESALRDVLEILADGPSESENAPFLQKVHAAVRLRFLRWTGREKKTSHRDEIRIILRALDFDEKEPFAQVWLRLPRVDSLDRQAHRQGLNAPRPVDSDFLDLWARMETILDTVLERFEGNYTKVFKTLDQLAKKNKPTDEDIRTFLQHIPNNRTAHKRFFAALVPSRDWLDALRKKSVFKTAPGVEHLPDGYIRFPEWPVLDYLKRMAATEPTLVAQILNEIQTSDNAAVQGFLLELAITLPPTDRALLTESAKGWMRIANSMFIGKAGADLIEKFADEGNADTALELSAVFLEVLPDPKAATPPSEPLYGAPYDPRTRIDEWQYGEFLKKEFQKIVAIAPWKALDLLSRLLCDFLEYDNAHAEHEHRDSTYISRPAVEEHEQNHMRDNVEHSLISGVRDIALHIIAADPTSLPKVIAALEEKKWTVFRRIALFLLSRYPAVDTALAARYITDKTLFEDHEIKHEYSLLLAVGFPLLTPEQQKEILDWIERGDEIEERVSKAEPAPPEERADMFRKNWQRDKLSIISAHLTGEWKTRYETLLAEVGQPEHPDFTSYSSSYVGPTSDTSPKALADMEPDVLIAYLKAWQPKKDTFHFGPTKEGLGRDITQAVILKPRHFESIAEQFKGLDPTYVRAYLQGFHDIDIANWDAVLGLCEWVMTQPRNIEGRKEDVFDEDAGWGWTKRTMASMLSRGAQKNLIPFALRERVWKLIEWIARDPQPTPEEEAKKHGDTYERDPYTMSINTVRGEGMEAAIQYALWVYRELGKTAEGKEALKSGFAVMPEVRGLLDKHLDNSVDPSVAVRAVYGRYFPWLHLIDKQWALQNLDRMMPPGHFTDRLYFAPWSAYVMYVGAFDDMLEPMRGRYKEAIENLKDVKEAKQRGDCYTRLVEHLMIYYMRGRLALSDELLTMFWDQAPAVLRGYALDFIGRNIASKRNAEDPLPADTAERLQALWEARAEAAEAATDKEGHKEEMAAFGWWFCSEKFPGKWSADQYLRSLEIAANKTQIDHLVADRLLELVDALPVETIGILRKIALTERPAWILLGNKDDVRKILTSGLHSGIADAENAARDLINRLAANGYPEFGDLLSQDAA